MKKIWILSLLVFIIACSKEKETPNDPTSGEEKENSYGLNNDDEARIEELHVMTYNIHAANPPAEAGIVDLYAIASVINESEADVVLLQEVDKNTGRNNFTGDQAKELGSLCKMNYHFYPAIIYKSGYYGVAILSRYPLLRPARHELPNETGLEQRVLGTAIVDLPGIDSVMIACTHLQNSSANNRIDQVKKIVDLLAPVSTPLIIGGDFNEKPTAERFFSIFDANFTRTCPGTDCPFTFSTGNPNAVIDYLAYKPTGSFTVTQHEVIEEKNASDHFPVIATFKFNR